MEMTQDAGGPGWFDLTDLVNWESEQNASRARARAWAISVFGLALASIGVYAGFLRSSVSTPLDYGEGTALAVVGLIVVAAARKFGVGSLRRKPNLLVVTNEAISYGLKGEQTLTQLRWDAPSLRLVLYDRTDLRAKLQDRDRFAVFSIVLIGGPSIPLTRDAFDAILSEATRHGLTLKRQELGSVGIVSLKSRRAK